MAAPTSTPPNADPARQAIAAIRGYAYQALAAARAWIDLDDSSLIYLEVAEDYAEIVGDAINSVQVKETKASGSVTLKREDVRSAIASFVDLTARNPDRQVRFRFLTTSPIGLERSAADRPGGTAGLDYWQRVRARQADIGPLRKLLEREPYARVVREFCKARNEDELRKDLVDRIHWDCGKPDAAALQRELELALIPILSRRFRIPSQEAPRVAIVLVHHVLTTSHRPNAADRVLTAADLNHLVDQSTRLSLPRATVEPLLQRFSDALLPTGATPAAISTAPGDSPRWLIVGALVPVPSKLIARPRLREPIQTALSSASVCLIFGATGVGKSMVARMLASEHDGGFHWIDLRNVDAVETQIRLDHALPLLASMRSSALILDDLNFLEQTSVQRTFAQLVDAARRYDMQVLVTTYTKPSSVILDILRLSTACVVECPHFSQPETDSLVELFGGDPATWGHLAHAAGAQGHPQLTYAFVMGLSDRDWPEGDLPRILADGLTTTDIETVRQTARKSLTDTLSEVARDLLNRLSIVTGYFKRSLALAISDISPSIQRAGEHFDDLVDQWIESGPTGRFRLSPLIRGFGREMLTETEQRRVHYIIATHMLQDSPVDARDIDTILVHALAGKSQESLWRLSYFVNTAPEDARQALANHLVAFRILNTSKPIYPDDLQTSVMLRLAQFRLVSASEDSTVIANVSTALLREAAATPHSLAGPLLELAVIGSVLNTLGIASRIDSWVQLLSRFRRLLHAHPVALSADDQNDEPPVPMAMFNIGVAGIDSVQKLETILNDLGQLEKGERSELLAPIDPAYADYQLLVHHPWTAEVRRGDFNPIDATLRYERMSRTTRSWGDSTLSLQCAVAAATIHDEHLHEPEKALRVLSNAKQTFGDHPVLTRALAKHHHSRGEYGEALRLYRDVTADLGDGDSVDAVFTLRVAAVAAAKCTEWSLARDWFLRAWELAGPLDQIKREAIRIGLRSDAAVASFEAGDLRAALALIKETLLALSELDPLANLQAAYCHRIVRHTILWLKSRVLDQETLIQGQPITIVPGTCSNPEPPEEIWELPLGDLDLAWYMLAEIEVTAGLNAGVRDELNRRTAAGQIVALEVVLRLTAITADVTRLDAAGFTDHLFDHLAAVVHALGSGGLRALDFDLADPRRELIPPLAVDHPLAGNLAEQAAGHAILAFALRSLISDQPTAVGKLREALSTSLGQEYPGRHVFETWGSSATTPKNADDQVARYLPDCLSSRRPPPGLLFTAGLFFLLWSTQSNFKPVLMPDLARWLSEQWKRVLRTQRFALSAPQRTVPPIEELLRRNDLEDEQFAARLTLLAADASLSYPLPRSTREQLSKLAGDRSA